MRRERMRARGPRGTRGLVEMVREQVKALTESSGQTVRAVEKLQTDVQELGHSVIRMDGNVHRLSGLMEAFAQSFDDLEARVSKLEKKGGKK
jgi:methyl-accepting chemotaxis protein